MSALYDLRSGVKDALVAANIGWTAETVIINRQEKDDNDLWNSIATAVSRAKHRCVLHIGVAKGDPLDDSGDANMTVALPITILAEPNIRPDSMPEEDLWEATVRFMCGLKLQDGDLPYQAFKFGGFQDMSEDTPGYLSRQTLFTTALYL